MTVEASISHCFCETGIAKRDAKNKFIRMKETNAENINTYTASILLLVSVMKGLKIKERNVILPLFFVKKGIYKFC
jgi:hypothetical protein